jgi:hypothetical protein
LWLEGHWTGKPLSFHDHHIKCGNSLIGVFDPDALKQGIPDAAFNPVTGDDKRAASAIKKRNKKERESPTRRLPFERTPLGRLEDLAQQLGHLSEVAEDNPADVKRKADLYRRIYESPDSYRAHRAANVWTAAFFVSLTRPDDPTVPTTESLRQFIDTGTAYGPMVGQADSLAVKHWFFHWFLEFPEVFAKGGFDVVLGNPPWERPEFHESSFWVSDPYVANAKNRAERSRRINEYRHSGDAQKLSMVCRFDAGRHDSDCESRFWRESKRFPLAAVGKFNLFALFAELARRLLNKNGRTGVIVQSGIATDDTCKELFADIVTNYSLVSLFDFENREALFSGVHRSYKFSLLTMSAQKVNGPEFAFFSTRAEHLRDPKRRFRLTPGDFSLLNPNTRTCPILRTHADAELTKKIYQHVPVLVNETTGENRWKVDLLRVFNMGFAEIIEQAKNLEELQAEEFVFDSRWTFAHQTRRFLPVMESKLINQYNHRFATYAKCSKEVRKKGQPIEATEEELTNPFFFPLPRFWLPEDAFPEAMRFLCRLKWLIGYRNFARSTDERTFIATIVPFAATDFPLRIMTTGFDAAKNILLLGNLNALPFDYTVRQKVGGTDLSSFIVKQLPVLSPGAYSSCDANFISPRVLELVYTGWDVKPFADDVWRDSNESLRRVISRCCDESKAATGGHELSPPEWAEIVADGIPFPPFRWEENRRAQIRSELDAYYAHLYGLTHDELRYILDPKDVYGPDFPGETFRVLKEKEEKLYGEYRTRRLILSAWDSIAAAVLA